MTEARSPLETAASGAQAPPSSFALGVGLTNECNLACAFCYRDPTRTDRLTPAQVTAVLDRIPVRSVNLGTGETECIRNFARFCASSSSAH